METHITNAAPCQPLVVALYNFAQLLMHVNDKKIDKCVSNTKAPLLVHLRHIMRFVKYDFITDRKLLHQFNTNTCEFRYIEL